MTTKTLKVAEIQALTEACIKLSNAHPTPAVALKLAWWSKPFIAATEKIIEHRNAIVKKFAKDGEDRVAEENMKQFIKANDEFSEEQQTITFAEFKMEWLDGVSLPGMAILSLVLDNPEEKSN